MRGRRPCAGHRPRPKEGIAIPAFRRSALLVCLAACMTAPLAHAAIASAAPAGAGRDLYRGASGNDEFDGGGDYGSDPFNAGSGRETASYATRASGVTAPIDGTANDGAPGEGDNTAGDVDNVQGGQGRDA